MTEKARPCQSTVARKRGVEGECVDLGGRRNIKKKKKKTIVQMDTRIIFTYTLKTLDIIVFVS